MDICITASAAFAKERKLTRQELPPLVAEAADRAAKGASIQGYVTEVENGERVYEAETVLKGQTRDLQFTKDGTLTEVEEEVSFESLPRQVQTALKQKARGAQIQKIESLTKRGDWSRTRFSL